MGELPYQFGISVAAVELINWLKSTQLFPFINAHSSTLNRWIAFAAALIGALGIQWAWQGNLTSGGDLSIKIPAIDVIVTNAAHIAAQWGMQKGYFRMTQPLPMAVAVVTSDPPVIAIKPMEAH